MKIKKLLWSLRWRLQNVWYELTRVKSPGNHRMVKVRNREGRNFRYRCLCGQYSTDDPKKCPINWTANP